MGGSEEDETGEAPAWLSRAAARYGGLDELAAELGSDGPREHVSERDVDEVFATLDDPDGDADTGGPETVVADRGVDDVFAEIEAAAPEPGTTTVEKRSAEEHPMLDTGPDPSFETLADGPESEVVDDADGVFEEFPEDDPAEVAAAAGRDDPAATSADTATADTTGGGATVTEAADGDATTGDGVEGVPADLFEDLAAAVEDPVDDGQDDTQTAETDDTGDVDVFEWVETASSPMTGGDGAADTSTPAEDPFESLADRAAPAPADVLEDSGDESTGVLHRSDGESADTGGGSDVPIGAWEYDSERGLHVVTDEESADEGEAEEAIPETAGASGRDVGTTDKTATAGGAEPDGGSSHVGGREGQSAGDPADAEPTAADHDTSASTREESTTARAESGHESETPSGERGTEPGPERDRTEPVDDATVLDGVDAGADDREDEVDGGPLVAGVQPAADGHGSDTDDGRSDVDTPAGDMGTVLGQTAGERDESTAEPETTGPDALENVGDGPEKEGVIGRVRSFIGRLLP